MNKKQRYSYIGGGFLLFAFGVGLAYLTGSKGLDFWRPVWHSLAFAISVAGLYFMWYGLHSGYYERIVNKIRRQLEEDAKKYGTGEHDI